MNGMNGIYGINGAKRSRRLGILIWHVHGSYLNAITRTEHDWYVPIKPGRPSGYIGRGTTFDMPEWVREVPAEQVRNLKLDLVIHQTPQTWERDQYELLSDAQLRLPKIYLEHNTPRPHPVETRHLVDDTKTLLVHVTHYNRLMWDNGRTPTTVIEHSVAIGPSARYTGELARGITVCNGMQRRPRIAGYDLFLAARERLPLDAVGMETEAFGGMGDIPYWRLHRLVGSYRFLYSPMRYTSLPLAVIEAMTLGMPVVALATTELPSILRDGENGFRSCDPEELVERMRFLLEYPEEALRLGQRARTDAQERFGLSRFVREWNAAFALVTGRHLAPGDAGRRQASAGGHGIVKGGEQCTGADGSPS